MGGGKEDEEREEKDRGSDDRRNGGSDDGGHGATIGGCTAMLGRRVRVGDGIKVKTWISWSLIFFFYLVHVRFNFCLKIIQ